MPCLWRLALGEDQGHERQEKAGVLADDEEKFVKRDLIDRIDMRLSGPEWVVPKKLAVEPQRQVCGPGTKVTCPSCHDHIGDINSPVYSGVQIAAEQVDFRPHQRRKRGGKAVCSKCGGIYMRLPRLANKQHGVLEVHTELGWI